MSNEIKVTGIVGSDVELRYTGNGVAVASFRVADSTNTFNKETKAWEQVGETIWWNCSVWQEKAEAVANNLKKGERVILTGKVSFRTYDGKEGDKRESKELRVNEISKPIAAKSGGSNGGGGSSAPSSANVAASDDDSPF